MYLTTFQEKRICLFFKDNIGHLTHVFALRTLIVAYAEGLKSPSLHEIYIETHCIQTVHVPIKFYNAIFIPRVRGECTTLCNCSQLYHICLQGNIGFCRGGEFRDGYC